MSRIKWTDLGEEDVYFSPEDDPAIQVKMKKESGVTWDISRILQKVPYSGSSTQQEMLELEQIMRELISEGKYSYKYIENMLLSLNYNLNKIRRVFRKLTGVEPDVYLDNQPYFDTPPSIPQINYGWGKSKDRDYDYYFVMPWDNKYCIFGQRGDIVREIVDEHFSLDDALRSLEKKVEKVFRYDRVLSEKDLAPKKKDVLIPEDFPVGIKVAQKDDSEKSKDSKTQDTVTSLTEKTDFFDTKTPAEFFEEVAEETVPTSVVDAIRVIFDYIESLNIPDYTIFVKDLMYRSKSGELWETQPSVEGIEISKSTFETPAYFVVVLLFKRDGISKKGLTVFLYDETKNTLETRGTFKGEDGKLYGLSKEGLDQYFNV